MQVTESSAVSSTTVSQDPRYAKYFKMLSFVSNTNVLFYISLTFTGMDNKCYIFRYGWQSVINFVI